MKIWYRYVKITARRAGQYIFADLFFFLTPFHFFISVRTFFSFPVYFKAQLLQYQSIVVIVQTVSQMM